MKFSKLIKKAGSVLGCSLDSFDVAVERSTLNIRVSILDSALHYVHDFLLLPALSLCFTQRTGVYTGIFITLYNHNECISFITLNYFLLLTDLSVCLSVFLSIQQQAKLHSKRI